MSSFIELLGTLVPVKFLSFPELEGLVFEMCNSIELSGLLGQGFLSIPVVKGPAIEVLTFIRLLEPLAPGTVLIKS